MSGKDAASVVAPRVGLVPALPSQKPALQTALFSDLGTGGLTKFFSSLLLSECLEPTAEAGLVASGRIRVQNTFVDGVLNQREGRREQRLGGGLILGVERNAQLADLVTQLRTVHPVELSPLASLPDPFERRFMACHVISYWRK